MAASIDWNEGAIARLRVLWAEGHSTAEIGRRMGVTKNAIVGKAHRLFLPPRPNPSVRRGDGAVPPCPPPRQRTRGSSRRPLPTVRTRTPGNVLPPAPALPPLLLPRRSDLPCCWPIGEPGLPGFRYCDQGAAAGRPYCPEHVEAAYVRSRAAPPAAQHA